MTDVNPEHEITFRKGTYVVAFVDGVNSGTYHFRSREIDVESESSANRRVVLMKALRGTQEHRGRHKFSVAAFYAGFATLNGTVAAESINAALQSTNPNRLIAGGIALFSGLGTLEAIRRSIRGARGQTPSFEQYDERVAAVQQALDAVNEEIGLVAPDWSEEESRLPEHAPTQ